MKTEVAYCKTFEDYRTCLECQSGFYLENNTCLTNPKNFIPNCKEYSNIDTCIECD